MVDQPFLTFSLFCTLNSVTLHASRYPRSLSTVYCLFGVAPKLRARILRPQFWVYNFGVRDLGLDSWGLSSGGKILSPKVWPQSSSVLGLEFLG